MVIYQTKVSYISYEWQMKKQQMFTVPGKIYFFCGYRQQLSFFWEGIVRAPPFLFFAVFLDPLNVGTDTFQLFFQFS